ncbi:Hyaluronidase-2, partial [Charadrius vociferus]
LALLALARQPPEKPSATPLLTRRPFLVAWNVPTQDCKPRFQVALDFSLFDLHASPNEGFVGQNLTIFYKERLGLYPYYTSQGVAVNGGVPQKSSLSEHLARLQDGIGKYIPSPTKEGLAGFESAAQQFMVSTLRVAKSFRPKQVWGYYLFPDCYNHDYSKNKESYTGQCPDVEKTRNDQLAWLWKESTALYPSIYLDVLLASTPNSRKFVRARVMEAMRISQQHHDGYSLPVFVYTRPTYIRKLDVLSQPDLISTIGESAALGAAGAIFWGDADFTKNRDSCQILKDYLEEDLGRYIVNVTTAAQLCSTALCQGRGRCLRQDSTADVFLHLNSTSFQLRRRDGDHPQQPLFWAEGQLSSADILFLRTHFHCHCYQGWQGSSCQ